MKVLIVGGAGFIGTNLCKKLKLKHQVVVLDHHRLKLAGVKSIIEDYANQKILTKLLPQIEIVYYLAWNSTPASSHSLWEERRKNIIPGQLLIKKSKKAGVRQFIFLSSAGTIYGRNSKVFLETDLPRPVGSYGTAKLIVENILRDNCNSRFHGTVVRATNAIGAGQKYKRRQGVVPAILTAANKQLPFKLWSNSRKDYLAVNDLVTALELCLSQKRPFDVFNVGSGTKLTVMEIVGLVEEVVGRRLDIKRLLRPAYEVNQITVDTQKIRQELGWRPKENVKRLISQIAQEVLRRQE